MYLVDNRLGQRPFGRPKAGSDGSINIGGVYREERRWVQLVWIVSSGGLCTGCLQHPVYAIQCLLSSLQLQPMVITEKGSQ
jgi:hypothetical protein